MRHRRTTRPHRLRRRPAASLRHSPAVEACLDELASIAEHYSTADAPATPAERSADRGR